MHDFYRDHLQNTITSGCFSGPSPITPPLPPSDPTPPPLPPIVPPPPPPPPVEEPAVEIHEPTDQGMADMEMSDEDDADPADQRPIEGGPGREISFTDELSTFYASLGGSSSLITETAPTPPSHSPTPPSRVESPLSLEGTHSPIPNLGTTVTKEEKKVKKKVCFERFISSLCLKEIYICLIYFIAILGLWIVTQEEGCG